MARRKAKEKGPQLGQEEIAAEIVGSITDVSLDSFTEGALKEYGSHVVENRAIPDFRDGLKPVHRAILWAMYDLNLGHNKPYKKAARTVGEVIGRFHPHGDLSAYGAMVTIANTKVPLVDGFGGWGDHVDDAAAMRYCFTGDTLISTEKGLVPIAEIPEVLGLKPKKRLPINLKVESRGGVEQAAFWLDSGIREIFNVSTVLGHIKGTSNEPLLVLDRNLEFNWRTIADLSDGDIVCYKRNPKVKWPSKNALLHQPALPTQTQLSAGYKVYGTPKRMSVEFATWLGLLISEGSICKQSVQFMNSDPDMVALFERLTKQLFEGIHVPITWREPDEKGWAKRPYAQVTINSTHIRKFLECNGVATGTAHTKEVPPCVMRGSKAEMVAFLSALFEGDGSAHNSGVSYTSASEKLLNQLQVILLTKFGLPFRQAKRTLYINSKTMHDKFQSEIGFLSERKGGNALNSAYDNQKLSWLPDVVREFYANTIEQEFDEFGKVIPKYERAMLRGLSGRAMPLCLEGLHDWLATVGKFVGKHFPTMVKRFKHVLGADYFLVPVKSINYIGDEQTYDLTVPGSNSYTANGMIVHNTEARLSKFSDMFLLDPQYLAVVPKVKNFSGDAEWPRFLPAKLPVQLLVGSPTVPAYGIRAGNPSFAIEGVIKLIKAAIKGKKITPEHCVKYLKIDLRWGGNCIASEADLLDFYASGGGNLDFEPDYELDYAKKEFRILSTCPGRFASSSTINSAMGKIGELKGVTWAGDRTAKGVGKYNICYVAKFGRVSELEMNELGKDILRIVSGRGSYELGWTHRKAEETTFSQGGFHDFINTWVKYRIALEIAVIKNLIKEEDKKLARQQLLEWAVLNRELIFEAVRSKKVHPVQHLMKAGKVAEEFARDALALPSLSLAGLDLDKIREKQREIKKATKALKADLKDPTARLVNQLDLVKL